VCLSRAYPVGSRGTFVKTVTRRNRDGSKVAYLQLVSSEWDAAAKTSRTKVLYSLGGPTSWTGPRSSG
jgi:hypothetical protein